MFDSKCGDAPAVNVVKVASIVAEPNFCALDNGLHFGMDFTVEASLAAAYWEIKVGLCGWLLASPLPVCACTDAPSGLTHTLPCVVRRPPQYLVDSVGKRKILVLGRTPTCAYPAGETNSFAFDVRAPAPSLADSHSVMRPHVLRLTLFCSPMVACGVPSHPLLPLGPGQVDRIDVSGIKPSFLANSGLLIATLVSEGQEVIDVKLVVQVSQEAKGGTFTRNIFNPLE